MGTGACPSTPRPRRPPLPTSCRCHRAARALPDRLRPGQAARRRPGSRRTRPELADRARRDRRPRDCPPRVGRRPPQGRIRAPGRDARRERRGSCGGDGVRSIAARLRGRQAPRPRTLVRFDLPRWPRPRPVPTRPVRSRSHGCPGSATCTTSAPGSPRSRRSWPGSSCRSPLTRRSERVRPRPSSGSSPCCSRPASSPPSWKSGRSPSRLPPRAWQQPSRLSSWAAGSRRRESCSTQTTRHALDLREHHLDLREQRISGMAAELAVGLAAGCSCPVCGSAEHPSPATRRHG